MDAPRQRSSTGWPPALAAGAVAVAAALGWSGCSLERDHEALSFFFDGVPEPLPPETAAADGSPAARGRVARGYTSAHSAYLERRCAECHGEQSEFGFVTTGFSSLTEAVCADCHEDVLDLPRQHGPVAAGACLACHQPHASQFRALLDNDAPALCNSCHLGELKNPPPDSPHSGPDDDCLSCHYGHGGSDRYFIRETIPATDSSSSTGPDTVADETTASPGTAPVDETTGTE